MTGKLIIFDSPHIKLHEFDGQDVVTDPDAGFNAEPLLSVHLEAGLSHFGFTCEDFEIRRL